MKSDRFSPAQVRAARGLLGWTQRKLARRAEIYIGDLDRYECGEASLGPKELGRIHRVLDRHNVVPTVTSCGLEGIRFRKPRRVEGAVLW